MMINFTENKRRILCAALLVNLVLYAFILGTVSKELKPPPSLLLETFCVLPLAILYISFEAYFYLGRDSWLWYASLCAHLILIVFDFAMMSYEARQNWPNHRDPFSIAHSIIYALAGVLEVVTLVLFSKLPKKVSSCCLPSYPVVFIDQSGKIVSQSQIVSGKAVYILNAADQLENQPTESVTNPVFDEDQINEE